VVVADKPGSFWTTLPGILTGLAALITAVGGLLGAVQQFRGDGGGEAATTSTAPTTTSATSTVSGGASARGAPEPARRPSLRRVSASAISGTASSELAPSPQGFTYVVENTLDGDRATAWVEGAAGAGIGQTLEYRFRRRLRLARLRIVNGYAKSEKAFRENARIRDAVLTTAAGTFPLELADHRRPQRVARDFGTTSFVRLSVKSVYPGSEFDDLAVTEIGFDRRASG
jgi:hypothetical protein